MTEIYLDNCATTLPYPEVIEVMGKVQREAYGNPSSRHRKGIEAEKLINKSRKTVAKKIGAAPEEIIFTAGGTESNNLAIRGIACRHLRRGKHIVTTPIEHPSVLNTYRQLEKEGFSISFIEVNGKGAVNRDNLQSLISSETTLVSIIHVNNETGFIQDIASLGRAVKKMNPKTFFHVDGVQSFCKVALKPLESSVDLLSLSAHKIHGPKGIGALWLRKGSALQPLLLGGNQENGLRPGTENTAAICGFAEAVSIAEIEHEETVNLYALKRLFYERINKELNIELNGPSLDEGAPHIINLSFPGIKSEVLSNALEEEGVYVSPGSACHSRRSEPSHVLTAMALHRDIIDSALRFSFSIFNSEDEIEEAARITINCVKKLQKILK